MAPAISLEPRHIVVPNTTFDAVSSNKTVGTNIVVYNNASMEWWEVETNSPAGYFIIYGIVGFFFFSFLAIVLVDMWRKSRTGELQESIASLGSLLMFLLKLPCIIFTKANICALGTTFTNLFRSKQKKKQVKRQPSRSRVINFDSQAIIDRLAAKDHPTPAAQPVPTEPKQPEAVVVKSTTGSLSRKKGKSLEKTKSTRRSSGSSSSARNRHLQSATNDILMTNNIVMLSSTDYYSGGFDSGGSCDSGGGCDFGGCG